MRRINTILNKDEIRKKFDKNNIDYDEEFINILEKEIDNKINTYMRHKNKILKDTSYADAIPFNDVYPNYDLSHLPKWITDRIDDAKVMGNKKETVILPEGLKYQLNNQLNHLSGGEWTYFTNSVLNTAYKTGGEDSYAHNIRKIHPTPKPPQLMRDIIKFFTKENEIVLDYFMGVGGTLLGAATSNRRAIGIELNPKYIEAYKQAAQKINCQQFECFQGDCLDILSNTETMDQLLRNELISLVLIDPPYGNMMSREKTGADIKRYGNVATPFTNSDRDFGNFELSDFFDKLKYSIELVLPYVKKRGHFVIFIKDLQPTGKETNLLHSKIVDKVNEIPNVNYKGMKIWADQTAKLFPYGYPFSFVANQIHQYILIFRKEK